MSLLFCRSPRDYIFFFSRYTFFIFSIPIRFPWSTPYEVPLVVLPDPRLQRYSPSLRCWTFLQNVQCLLLSPFLVLLSVFLSFLWFSSFFLSLPSFFFFFFLRCAPFFWLVLFLLMFAFCSLPFFFFFFPGDVWTLFFFFGLNPPPISLYVYSALAPFLSYVWDPPSRTRPHSPNYPTLMPPPAYTARVTF